MKDFGQEIRSVVSEPKNGARHEDDDEQAANARESIALIHTFASAWERCDVEGVVGLLATDIVYQNVPSPALVGRDSVRSYINPSLSAMTHMIWEFSHCIASPDGRRVAAERVDRFFFSEGEVAIAVMGLFEVERGLISRWRDYADLGHFARQMISIGRAVHPSLLDSATKKPPADKEKAP